MADTWEAAEAARGMGGNSSAEEEGVARAIDRAGAGGRGMGRREQMSFLVHQNMEACAPGGECIFAASSCRGPERCAECEAGRPCETPCMAEAHCINCNTGACRACWARAAAGANRGRWDRCPFCTRPSGIDGRRGSGPAAAASEHLPPPAPAGSAPADTAPTQAEAAAAAAAAALAAALAPALASASAPAPASASASASAAAPAPAPVPAQASAPGAASNLRSRTRQDQTHSWLYIPLIYGALSVGGANTQAASQWRSSPAPRWGITAAMYDGWVQRLRRAAAASGVTHGMLAINRGGYIPASGRYTREEGGYSLVPADEGGQGRERWGRSIFVGQEEVLQLDQDLAVEISRAADEAVGQDPFGSARGNRGGNSGGALGSGPQSQTRNEDSAPLNSPHITSALDAHNAPPGPPAGPTTAPTDPLSNTSTPRMTQGGTASPRACLTAVGSNQRAGGRPIAAGGGEGIEMAAAAAGSVRQSDGVVHERILSGVAPPRPPD